MADQIDMSQGSKKKGLSKGCFVSLIVVGVLAVMVIAAGIVCYVKKDALLKSGSIAMIGSFKTQLGDNPVEGVDTVEVNRIADAFIQKLQESELDLKKYGHFAQEIQSMVGSTEVDSVEVEQFIKAMTDYFPELMNLRTSPEEPDTTDTSMVPE
ncbi:MAG: hypothetical protein U9R56_00240 [candidate division Zixibacteria bacterium]|nr:hypothetical protein [candidate division Zixibacteria bacterium]